MQSGYRDIAPGLAYEVKGDSMSSFKPVYVPGVFILAVTLLLLLAACGSGESGEPPESNGGSLLERLVDDDTGATTTAADTEAVPTTAPPTQSEPIPTSFVLPTPKPLPTRSFVVPTPTPVVLAEDTPPLHRAAFNGELEAVRELLEQGEFADTEFRQGDEAYRTPLHAAVMNNHVEVVELLLEWGASVDYSHLSVAAVHNGDPAMVELLLERRDKDADPERLLYALSEAAAHSRNPETVEVLLDAILLAPDSSFHVDSVTRRGNKTALHWAAQSNPNPAVTQLLLKRGADIGAYAEYGDYAKGWTALHLAALHNPEPAVVEVLLQWAEDAGSPYRVVGALNTCCNSTPLHDAVRHRADHSWGLSREEDDATGAMITGLLLDYGADIEAETQDGTTPLAWAVRNHSHLTAAVLLDRGADISIKRGGPFGLSDLSLLHWTVRNRLEDPNDEGAVAAKLATMQLLLDRGLNIDEREGDGKTALLIALESQDALTVEFLLEQGANPNFKDEDGTTPCSLAAVMATWIAGEGPSLAKLFEGHCQ